MYLLCRFIQGVLTHSTALERHWDDDETFKFDFEILYTWWGKTYLSASLTWVSQYDQNNIFLIEAVSIIGSGSISLNLIIDLIFSNSEYLNLQ